MSVGAFIHPFASWHPVTRGRCDLVAVSQAPCYSCSHVLEGDFLTSELPPVTPKVKLVCHKISSSSRTPHVPFMPNGLLTAQEAADSQREALVCVHG